MLTAVKAGKTSGKEHKGEKRMGSSSSHSAQYLRSQKEKVK